MLDTIEPGGVWNEPGGGYFRSAQDELGIADDELELLERGAYLPAGHVPIGDYPNLDRVYARAWELREADEGE